MSYQEIRASLTLKIIESLKKGQRPWVRPWTLDPNCGHPTNFVSKKPYRGINPLLLTISSLDKGLQSCYWATFNQWQELGGKIKKRPKGVPPGEWGTPVVFYGVAEVEDKNTPAGEVPKKRKIYVMRNYTVFNLDQVEGAKFDKFRPTERKVVTKIDWKPAEKLIEASGAKIDFGGNRAVYMPPYPVGSFPAHSSGDRILCPHERQFPEKSEFYMTLFHELAHHSECRLKWTGSYEMGELVAEISACYLAAELGLPNNNMDNHNKYLAAWLKHMENDPKWIFHASTQSSKVADYLLSFIGKGSENKEEMEPEEACQ